MDRGRRRRRSRSASQGKTNKRLRSYSREHNRGRDNGLRERGVGSRDVGAVPVSRDIGDSFRERERTVERGRRRDVVMGGGRDRDISGHRPNSLTHNTLTAPSGGGRDRLDVPEMHPPRDQRMVLGRVDS
ncbi:unnamed protein product, partial [Discosporangium mesarthrocarpum]